MSTKLVIITLFIYSFGLVWGGCQLKRFIIDSTYEVCEGEDSANYTDIQDFESDLRCTFDSIDFGAGPLDDDVIIACLPNSQRQVTTLQTLARSVYPAGAFWEVLDLSLGLTGYLEGKYILRRAVVPDIRYLKECSSPLGQQIVASKTRQMLIAKRLDLNCLIAPNGCWDVFKKSCTTVCTGRAFLFQADAVVYPLRQT